MVFLLAKLHAPSVSLDRIFDLLKMLEGVPAHLVVVLFPPEDFVASLGGSVIETVGLVLEGDVDEVHGGGHVEGVSVKWRGLLGRLRLEVS